MRFFPCVILAYLWSSVAAASPCPMGVFGAGAAVYYDDGHVFTYNAGRAGSTWFYSDGSVMTSAALSTGAPLFYRGGRPLSNGVGRQGEAWYFADGKVITYAAGQSGAIWYYDNGNIQTPTGPSLDTQTLWLMACEEAIGS